MSTLGRKLVTTEHFSVGQHGIGGFIMQYVVRSLTSANPHEISLIFISIS